MNIFYIGGSPCSGKSTVAELLSERFGLAYFKADDYLDEFTARGAAAGLPVCQRIQRMTADEIWMRPPEIQCTEEMDYYAEIAPFVSEKLRQLSAGPIIAEGAAFLPRLMIAEGVKVERYIAIIPEREFQISRYSQRPWVPHMLRDCADPEAAFRKWMERDALFALAVKVQCEQHGYSCLMTDGSIPPETRAKEIAVHFSLDQGLCQKCT